MKISHVLAALAAAVSLVAPAAAGARATLGIADEQPAMFADARFTALGVHQGRLVVPWDVLSDAGTLARVDRWMAGARAARVAPLVTIGPSRRPGMRGTNPRPTQMAAALRAWRARWPGQITTVSTWNEGNLDKRPATVAKWYLALRRACPACTILGADVVDTANVVRWTRSFVRAAHRSPAVWGLHAYTDANRFTTKQTRAFLRAVSGRVWLTETGGVLRRSRPRARFAGTGPAHAAKATAFLLDKVVEVSPRIGRVYVYSWATSATDTTWDSGLVGPDGSPRPALAIVQRYQARR